jgi:hypothetical protein
MNDTSTIKKPSAITELLFNPFHYIAGGRALITGVTTILLAAVIGHFSGTRFDGLMDAHFGGSPRAPIWIFVVEGLCNWFTIALVVTLTARLVTKSRYRSVDVFGTMALARYPYLFIAILGFLPGITRYSQFIASKYLKNVNSVTALPFDMPVFIAGTMITMLLTIFSVVLSYRAFSVSCNARGSKAVWYFVVVFLLCEIITKLVSFAISNPFAL